MVNKEGVALIGLLYNLENVIPDYPEEIRKIWSELSEDNEFPRVLEIAKEAWEIASASKPKAPNKRLRCIFSDVSIDEKEKPIPKYYQIRKLEFDKFPVLSENEEISPGEIDSLLKDLKEEFKKVKSSFNSILTLFEKYFTFFPASEDVSLYDQMKLTSAITLAIYNRRKETWRDGGEFLLIGADFSGIQDFIYTINMRGALKHLRARSTYLDLISWDIVMEILEELNLTRANLIYNGGGSFTIIAQNTEEAVEKLEKIRNEVVKWLYDEFNGKLYIAIDWIEATRSELKEFKKGSISLWTALKDRVNERKVRKFEEIIGDDFFIDRSGVAKRHECDVCRKQISEVIPKRDPQTGEAELNLCHTCAFLLELGKHLPYVTGFARIPKRKEDKLISEWKKKKLKMPFSSFYFIKDDSEAFILWSSGATLLMSEEPFRIREFDAIPYIVADYAKKVEEEVEENGKKEIKKHIITFEGLAENSLGAERIGVLRADVDNLGLIFARGLKNPVPARVSMLSRLMDYFFKGYLNEIIKGSFDELLPKDIPRLCKDNDEANIVVVYAGGDDLFIVGSWDEVFNLAFKVRELFKLYTGGNPSVTLSAGLGFFDENYPLARMAETTKDRLETAKDEGKNRISLLERRRVDRGKFPEHAKRHKISYGWDEYKGLWAKYVPRVYDGRKLKVSKSLLWKILQAQELYVMNPMSISWNYILAYYLSRNNAEELFKELLVLDVSKVKNYEPQEIYFVDGILKVLLFAVRGWRT
nr:type III-A CRISPR-associated protein Cas10/Csm1 [Thermococcus sp. LS2]